MSQVTINLLTKSRHDYWRSLYFAVFVAAIMSSHLPLFFLSFPTHCFPPYFAAASFLHASLPPPLTTLWFITLRCLDHTGRCKWREAGRGPSQSVSQPVSQLALRVGGEAECCEGGEAGKSGCCEEWLVGFLIW